MDISGIKRRLARPATRLTAGGFRPTEQESWIGKVFLYRPDEAVPLDAAREEMLPLAGVGTLLRLLLSPLAGERNGRSTDHILLP